MPTPPEPWPLALARTWAIRYNRLLALAVALREFTRKGWPDGQLRDLVTAAAWKVLDAEDHLIAWGYDPGRYIGGDEATLRRQTFEYLNALPDPVTADLGLDEIEDRVRRTGAAWGRYADALGSLPDECFAGAATLEPGALRPERLAATVGHRRHAARSHEQFGESGGERPDLRLTVRAGA